MQYQNQLFNPELYQRSEFVPVNDPACDDTDPTPEPPKTVLEQVTEDTNSSALNL